MVYQFEDLNNRSLILYVTGMAGLVRHRDDTASTGPVPAIVLWLGDFSTPTRRSASRDGGQEPLSKGE
jgi:hypothetical protein